MVGRAGNVGGHAASVSSIGSRSAKPSQGVRAEAIASAGALGERLAATPRLACEALARALRAGDVDAALTCFAPDACVVGPDGRALHGETPIRALLAQLIEARAEIAIELAGVLVAGELALAHERWVIASGGASGSRSAPTTDPTLVLRQIEGEWRLAIAAPWGWASTPPLQAI